MDKRNPVSQGRIEINERGIGEISDVEIGKRAREIALADGRPEPTDADFERAREDLGMTGPPPPPEEAEAEPSEWGVPPNSTGESAVRITLEDEDSPAEQLFQEGLDEADHDQRVAAASQELEEEE